MIVVDLWSVLQRRSSGCVINQQNCEVYCQCVDDVLIIVNCQNLFEYTFYGFVVLIPFLMCML